MIINDTKTQNFNATSAIKVGDENKPVMYMYGSINEAGNPSWNSSINDVQLYLANQAEVDADFDAFKHEILDSLDE